LSNPVKISLVHLFLPEQNQTYPPVGIMSIASALRDKEFEVNIFHESATDSNLSYIVEKSKGALFTGLSVMTGKTLLPNLKLSRLLKSNNIPVVWGGIHPTFLPETTIKNEAVDFIIMGEGEESACEFAEKLKENSNLSLVKGLGYKKDGKIILNERSALISNLDKYRLNWDDIKVQNYLRPFNGNETFLSYLTSRGCPHRCGFCYNLYFNNRHWRPISADFVIKDIKSLKDKYNFDGIDFLDDNFFTDKNRAFKIVSSIEMPWIAEVRADYVNEDFIKQCKDYNCYKLIMGCESGSDKTLKAINKDTTIAQIENSAKLCYKYGIRFYCSFMMMMPGEGNYERDETIKFINKLMDTYKGIEIDGPKIYTPYPGTPLFALSKQLGWKEPQDIEEWSYYHRSMNPHRLGYIDSKDIKKYSALLGALAVKRDILTKLSENKRINIFTLFNQLYLKISEWRLKNCIYIFPFDIKLYILLMTIKRKIIYLLNNQKKNRI